MIFLLDYYYVIIYYQYYQLNIILDKGKDELIIYESKYDKLVNIFYCYIYKNIVKF